MDGLSFVVLEFFERDLDLFEFVLAPLDIDDEGFVDDDGGGGSNDCTLSLMRILVCESVE